MAAGQFDDASDVIVNHIPITQLLERRVVLAMLAGVDRLLGNKSGYLPGKLRITG